MPNILDKRFKYTPAASTNIAKTFARIRKQQAQAAMPLPEPTPPANVATLPKRVAK